MTQSNATAAKSKLGLMHPLVVMVFVVCIAALATYVLPAGHFLHHDKFIVAGTYHEIAKKNDLSALFSPTSPSLSDKPARAASIVSLFTCLPGGLLKAINLIIMVLCSGGMFQTLRRTGAIDKGIEVLLARTSGNSYLLACSLLIVLACASTFLGTLMEYLLIIPIVSIVGDRLGLPKMFAMAVVGIAAKIGFAASVTNPYALTVAQPLAGVPVFSGIGLRLTLFVIFLTMSMAYVVFHLRRWKPRTEEQVHEVHNLSPRQILVLLTLLFAGVGIVLGTKTWAWGGLELAACYIALAVGISVVAGLTPGDAAEAFLGGMQAMMLGALMVGMAASAELLLSNSQVMDTIIAMVTRLAQNPSAPVVANALMGVEMLLDIVIGSISGKAALSIPILLPVAHLNGISGQVTVMAFVLGGGLMNMVTPTCGPLLAFLAAARVSYVSWIKFILPLWLALCLVAVAALSLATIFHL